MSDREALPAQFAEWIDRSLEGTITPEQWQRLDTEIAINDAACDFYVRYLAIYVGLVYKEGVLPKPRESIHQEIQDGIDEIVIKRPAVTAPLRLDAALSDEERKRKISDYARQKLEAYLVEDQCYIPKARWDTTAFLIRMQQKIRGMIGIGRRVTRMGVYAGIVGLIMLIVGHQIVARQVVAHVTDTVHAVWSEPIDGQALRRGWLTLRQGFARIEFSRGTQVIAQGPCEFKLESSNRMFLSNGAVTVTVPKQAIGFTVQTPASTIVDYGTEFGVSTNANKGAEVHVFQGRVGVKGSGRKQSKTLKMLEQGAAAVVDQDGSVHLENLADRSHRFVRNLPDASLKNDQLLRDLIVYYTFDETRGVSTLTDSSGQGLTADIMGYNVLLEQPGMVGTAVEAGGDGTSYIAIDDHPGNGRLDHLPAGMDLDGTFSLSCWISFPNPPRNNGIFGSNYVMGSIDLNKDPDDRHGLCFVRKPGIEGVYADDFIRAYDDTGKEIYDLFRRGVKGVDLWDDDASDGFHHYVLVCNENGRVEWYRDNVMVRSAPFQQPLTGNLGGKNAWIFGANAEPSRLFPDRVLFDEFAVWDRALTTLEIAHLYYRGLAGISLNTPGEAQ